MNQEQTVSLQLAVSEANLILTHLGTLPYNQVANLILKIQAQAQVQLTRQSAAAQQASTPQPQAQAQQAQAVTASPAES